MAVDFATARRTAAAYLGACHPLPTLAVTLLTAGLAVLAHTGPAVGALLTAAVFTGQLSIGWSNDSIDAARDTTAHRTDKPAAQGEVPSRDLMWAASATAATSLVLSLLVGPAPGVTAFAIVVCGWAYNLGLKATAASFVPYAVAFGLLPAAATLSPSDGSWPHWWVVVCGALLGVTAHIANVLPDLDTDRDQGVRGMPQRLGPTADTVLVPTMLTAITALVLFAPGTISPAASLPVIAVAVAAASAATVAGLRRTASPWFFRGVVVVALCDVVLFAALGVSLG